MCVIFDSENICGYGFLEPIDDSFFRLDQFCQVKKKFPSANDSWATWPMSYTKFDYDSEWKKELKDYDFHQIYYFDNLTDLSNNTA